jgi:hypothetical protein
VASIAANELNLHLEERRREFQSENADSRGIELLDVLDECMSKAG